MFRVSKNLPITELAKKLVNSVIPFVDTVDVKKTSRESSVYLYLTLDKDSRDDYFMKVRISDHFPEYGFDLSFVYDFYSENDESKFLDFIKDNLIPILKKWKSHPLQDILPEASKNVFIYDNPVVTVKPERFFLDVILYTKESRKPIHDRITLESVYDYPRLVPKWKDWRVTTFEPDIPTKGYDLETEGLGKSHIIGKHDSKIMDVLEKMDREYKIFKRDIIRMPSKW